MSANNKDKQVDKKEKNVAVDLDDKSIINRCHKTAQQK